MTRRRDAVRAANWLTEGGAREMGLVRSAATPDRDCGGRLRSLVVALI